MVVGLIGLIGAVIAFLGLLAGKNIFVAVGAGMFLLGLFVASSLTITSIPTVVWVIVILIIVLKLLGGKKK